MTRLLVASTGGHLAELLLLAPRFSPASQDELWVTFDSKQSRALLADRNVRFIRDTPPRDWRGVLANTLMARQMFKHLDIDTVISDGAGIALSFLPLASAKKIPTHYIESFARLDGPSVTGRILQRVHGIRLYTQHQQLANARWRFAGSVFDSYGAVDAPALATVRKVVVTTGTLGFSFRRLLDRLEAVLPKGIDLVVQAGTDSSRLDWPGATVRAMMDPEELGALMEDADAVVAHAGIGSILTAFEAGKRPVLVPRLKSYEEHVDDHQVQIARRFAASGLAVMADASTIDLSHFSEASMRRIARAPEGHTFSLT